MTLPWINAWVMIGIGALILLAAAITFLPKHGDGANE